ncbi:cytochrome bc1 complex diheme cytochrome c subunit [Dactylosporangium matsuzakiense]|uniref:Cytochrome bc1 complex cytochrome c subunit n=1 Tax=Dactylosporangium matsuzakiense TaxID=53360 RepID=A0A9W6KP71_9ACTN|nr:cytochrome c [Dactylosporangium matsuzakiense]UWZ43457.1 c-type cytochrome [Dactylosporangium matsuzakiense]GLL02949.1 putative ubiquinol-cytochrome c reductase cytochrome c subunit [Dactylosporangium matsuzakiense]
MTSEQSKRPLARLVPGGARAARGKLRRRIEAAVRLIAALTIVGGLYSAYAPGVGRAEDVPALSDAAKRGKEIYETSCITCHGTNAQGVQGRGPSLIGVGSAAVEFQVNTGRMPLARQEAQAQRKDPQFTEQQAADLGAYIQELGGGPVLPGADSLNADVKKAQADPKVLAHGGELYRVNCSSCHAFSTGGGALSSGKYAPTLQHSSNRDIYGAMLTGPQNMPVFGNNQLSPDDKAAIIAYIQNLNQNPASDPGGWNIGRYGPVPEGLVIFLVGIAALVFATLWIAGKS